MTINFSTPPVAPEPAPEARVMLGIDLEPPKQKRVTILFRFILAFPLLFVAAALSYVIGIVGIAAWFAALFTKRVPEGLHAFMTSCLRVVATTNAYYALLLPTWPGVPFDEEDEKWLSLRIDRVEHNRASVFFRIVLAVPAYFLQLLLTLGQGLLVFIMWIVGIFTGRTPKALHQAVCAILRYNTRTTAYIFLLTPNQPWHGLFGDNDVSAAPTPAPATPTPASATPPEASTPEMETTTASTGYISTAPLPFAPPATEPATHLSTPPAGDLPTSWPLSRGAKASVGISIGLGSLATIAYGALIAFLIVFVSGQVQAENAAIDSWATTSNTARTFSSALTTCQLNSCRETAAGVARDQQTTTNLSFKANYGTTSRQHSQYYAYVYALAAVRADYDALSYQHDPVSFNALLNRMLIPDLATARTTYVNLVTSLGAIVRTNSNLMDA